MDATGAVKSLLLLLGVIYGASQFALGAVVLNHPLKRGVAIRGIGIGAQDHVALSG